MKKYSSHQMAIITLSACLLPLPGWTHGDTHEGVPAARKISAEEHAFGREGDAKRVTRSITVDMGDKMRFMPAEISVKRGETVRFVVKNSGNVMHEMVIGTMNALREHADLMKKHPGMEHDEPYMTHVRPGRSEQMVWQFTKAGVFHYGCLVPGHFEAGMVGKIIVN